MTGMFRRLDLFVLSCLFLTVISEAGEILPPQNLTLRWIDDFTPELSWIPQDPVRKCNYIVEIQPQTGYKGWAQYLVNTPMWSDIKTLGGRSLRFSVSDCSGNSSNSAVYEISYPELVKKVNCYYYAPQKTRCEWIPASDASELRFFFKLKDEVTVYSDKIWSEFQECSLYSKTGCELQANDHHTIYILFNGTVNSTRSRNTFEIQLKDYVKPPALKWTVVESKAHFNISWIAPDILALDDWKYNIEYECNETKSLYSPSGVETSYQLQRNAQCRHCIAIQAVVVRGGAGETERSAKKCFDKDVIKDLHALVFVAVFIPCVVATLAALMFVCCRRHKNKFWPKIIKPVDFITDIDNNNKSNLYNLHTPAEEERTCEITVLDPEIIRLDC